MIRWLCNAILAAILVTVLPAVGMAADDEIAIFIVTSEGKLQDSFTVRV